MDILNIAYHCHITSLYQIIYWDHHCQKRFFTDDWTEKQEVTFVWLRASLTSCIIHSSRLTSSHSIKYKHILLNVYFNHHKLHFYRLSVLEWLKHNCSFLCGQLRWVGVRAYRLTVHIALMSWATSLLSVEY